MAREVKCIAKVNFDAGKGFVPAGAVVPFDEALVAAGLIEPMPQAQEPEAPAAAPEKPKGKKG